MRKQMPNKQKINTLNQILFIRAKMFGLLIILFHQPGLFAQFCTKFIYAFLFYQLRLCLRSWRRCEMKTRKTWKVSLVRKAHRRRRPRRFFVFRRSLSIRWCELFCCTSNKTPDFWWIYSRAARWTKRIWIYFTEKVSPFRFLIAFFHSFSFSRFLSGETCVSMRLSGKV